MRNVLWLVGCVLVVGCGEGVGFTGDEEGTATVDGALTQRLRIVAANLTSGTQQSYDPGHGARILDGLDPDIVLLQEFNDTDVPGFVSATFGSGFHYVRGNASEQIPNGVVSRYEIKSSGTWTDARVNGTRGFTWALIDVPGSTDVFAVSVHLSTSSSSTRSSEAAALVSLIKANAPAGAWVVIGGDLNTNSRTESAVGSFAQVVTTSGPWPVDRNGNANTNASRSKPYDWVMVSAGLAARETATVVGSASFTHGLVADTRVFSPISALAPALAGDSGATNMQHMAVVRDFAIETGVTGGGGGSSGGGAGGGSAGGGAGGGSALVFINEVLANEPGSNADGEFIELVNLGTAPADLGGWKLADGTATRHVFPAGTTLPPHAALVVTGANASTGTLSLGNSGDSVTLSSAQGSTIDSLTYTSALSGTDGVSMNRSPDGSSAASFVLHTALAPASSSPGTRADGSAF